MVKYRYDAWGNHAVRDANGADIADASHIGNRNPFRYRGYYYDTETELYYLKTRYYDPETGRFITIDGIEYLDPETINGLNLYAYCGNNPVMHADPTGRFLLSFLASLLIAAIVGAGVGVAGTFVGDLVTSALTGSWQFSSWETYLGAAIGGAVGGVVSLVNPFAGAIVAGTLSTFAGHAIGKITGSNTSSWFEIGVDTVISLGISIVTVGMSKYLKIPGITKGSHSFQQVFKAGFTKALRYQFSMSIKTLAKEAVYLLISGFTTGFLVSNVTQGAYNGGKIWLKRWI